MIAVIRETYEIVTQASAAEGDADDRGWIDEDGSEYSFREAVRLLEGCEPSSSVYHLGVWYTRHGDMDCHTGDVESRSYHLSAPDGFQRRLYQWVTR